MDATGRKDVLLLASPPLAQRTAGIGRFAKEAGWNLLAGKMLFDGMRGWRGDGALVTLRDDPAVVALARRLRRRGIPVVDMTAERPDLDVPRVCVDNRAIGRLAAEHLAGRNYRNAAFFSTNWSPIQAARYEGFAQGLADMAAERNRGTATHRASDVASGVAPARWVLAESVAAARRNDSTAVSRWFAGLLRSAKKPIAVFCNETQDAARVLAECRSCGIAVPEDVAILGVGDNLILCENQSVPLSCILQNGERLGYESAALLARLMDGMKAPASPVLVPPQGVAVRASTECTASSDPLVARALALVARNLSRPWGVGQLAAEVGVSPTSLNRRFVAELGRPPSAEIARQRMYKAVALVRDTHLPLAEIARLCGICNASYLSTLFRRETGRTVRQSRAAPNP